MSDQLMLFDAPSTTEPEKYHEVGIYDLVTVGCTDCVHLREHKKVSMHGRGYDFRWTCTLTRNDINPDFGTCGRFRHKS
jgi:hypothetical protein